MEYEFFFKKHYSQIRTFIYNMVLNWHDAEDITQDTFTSFFLVDKTGKVMDGSVNYLYQCARRKVYNYTDNLQRKRRKYKVYEDMSEGVIDNSHIVLEEKLLYETRLEMIHKELHSGKMNKGKRCVIKFHFEGLEPEVISKEMGILPHSVYTAKNRAIEEIRKKFGN